MFRNFFSPKKELTRLESSAQLKDLVPLLQAITAKKDELLNQVDGNATDNGFVKSHILQNLVNQLDRTVDDFNKQKTPETYNAEIAELIKFVSRLSHIINGTAISHKTNLDTPRNKNKSYLDATVRLASFSSVVGVAVVTGSALATGGTLFVAAPYVCDRLLKLTGLNDKRSSSLILLDTFSKKLSTIRDNLDTVLNGLSYDSSVNEIIPLICPITQQRIKIPALCVLDGRMYEKEDIEKWLLDKRTSPINRVKMKADAKTTDVLIENISLRDALDEYESMVKKLMGKKPSTEETESTSTLLAEVSGLTQTPLRTQPDEVSSENTQLSSSRGMRR